MRRMVISSIVTVGNYEYAYYWYLYQDGRIEYEVKLTGVISNGVVARQTPEYGTSSPRASTDRTTSTSSTCASTWRSTAPPTGSTRSPRPATRRPGQPGRQRLAHQGGPDQGRDHGPPRRRPLAGRYWKVVNKNVTNELGQPVAYKLMPSNVIRPFAHPGSAVARRALHLQPALGDRLRPGRTVRHRRLPQPGAGGAGLPAFATRANLTDTDVVLWFTFGTNHVVRPEDWPVMPVHPIGFRLSRPASSPATRPSTTQPRPPPLPPRLATGHALSSCR